MRRSSSIRCLSEVIGETSSDDKIRNRARKEGPRARRTGASQLPRSGLVQPHITPRLKRSGQVSDKPVFLALSEKSPAHRSDAPKLPYAGTLGGLPAGVP